MAKPSRSTRRNPDAHNFDQFLKKLETTKQRPQPFSTNESHQQQRPPHQADSSDNSTVDSRNESAIFDLTTEHNQIEDRQMFETRQCFVDRSDGSPTCQDSVDSFIRMRSSDRMEHRTCDAKEQYSQGGHDECTSNARIYEEGLQLPDAILKLDRRHAIPTPKHKSDILVEIEASTVDRRDLMVRPGVRCTGSLPQGVETTGMDCIGRVVQLTTHARAVYGISIDDRVAAIYPFEYKDGYKDKGRRNDKYALVDAGYVVTVPKHVDAAEASTMVRLYLGAFQSIAKGRYSGLHNRYGANQLEGQSILIQNGSTELGRALIDLAVLLGASQIFATGPTECHPILMELGAVPLGTETFGWELFIEQKLSLVLVQEMPTADNFEQFISVLDENKGDMVYIHHGHKHVDDDDHIGINVSADGVGCNEVNLFHDLTHKLHEAINNAKFSLRLACSPKFIVYDGIWPSCKENPSQFKEDLRYLFTLLGQGNLKPHIDECINSEEVTEVQDRIELLGKKGTVVCLPTALFEKKAGIISRPQSQHNQNRTRHVVSPRPHLKRDEPCMPALGADFDDRSCNSYASDAGYVTHACDALSDFHRMHYTGRTNLPSPGQLMSSLPALPESTSYSDSNFNSSPRSVAYQPPPDLKYPAMCSSSPKQFYSNHDASSAISSMGSATNAPSSRTSMPAKKEDPPLSIQFRNTPSRRHRAYQRRKRSNNHSKNAENKEENGEIESCPQLVVVMGGGGGHHPGSTCSTKKLRRKARQREQTGVAITESAGEEERVSNIVDGKTVRRLARKGKQRKQRPMLAAIASAVGESIALSVVEEKTATKADAIHGLRTEAERPIVSEHSYAMHQTRSESHAIHASSRTGSCKHQNSRNEDECEQGDFGQDDASHTSSFHALINKWQTIDDMRHQSVTR